ncbi:MAG: ATPase, T2SS/T4P/T4SS family [Tepidisphaeraceae bacterium]
MPEPYIEIQNAEGRRNLPVTDQPITVGRHSSNVVALTDGQASRYHCVIEKSPEGGLRVRDLDSSNGTRVNGQLVKQMRIGDGDTVTVGKTSLKLVAPSAAPVGAGARAGGGGGGGGIPTANRVVDVEVDFDDEEEGEATAADFERVLVRTAESLPDKKFNELDIALVNARGQLAHAARNSTEKPKKAAAEQSREAVGILRLILLICFRTRASDIHIESKQDDYTVRVRVDGTMVDTVRLPKDMGVRVLSLVKILSDIDIAQRNIVQEGHFTSRVPDRRVDYRVSFAPAMFGQKLVIRILDTANTPYHVWDLQLPEWMYEVITGAMKQDSGMFLVCGPTGSGKTSTLYAVIRDIDVGERNVVTIEDPVEIQLDGVTQIPVNESQGNTFAALLRSVLRQDPDAILVGEVRDPETAKIALQAAITGHLVFSTIHSRDSMGTIFRLLDLGLEPYLVASGLQLVLAQRLVRQLCPACKVPAKPTPEQAAKMGKAAEGVEKIYTPRGCPRCVGTGYAGRRGVFELLKVSEEMREVMLKSPTMGDIQKSLSGTKFVKLAESGYLLVAEGVTSLEEVERSM